MEALLVSYYAYIGLLLIHLVEGLNAITQYLNFFLIGRIPW